VLFTSFLSRVRRVARATAISATLLAGVSAPSGAIAQTYAPSTVAVSLDDRWAMTPIIETSGAVSGVHSFLALNKAGHTGGEIKAVWYTRDPANTCKWTAVTWDSANTSDAIKHVKLTLGINDESNADWGVPVDMTAATPAQQVIDYAKGFAADDPLGQLVNDLNNPWRDEDVAFLASIGYKAADVPFERKDASDDPEHANQVLSASAALVSSFAALAPPLIPTPGVAPPDGFPAWPTGPGPAPAPWTIPCASCPTMTMTMYGAWSGWTAAGTWALRFDGPSNGQPGVCGYRKHVCRYREVWTVSVAANCAVTYTFAGYDSQCWYHDVVCDADVSPSGVRSCPTVPNGQGCTATLTVPNGPPTNPASPLVPHP